MFLIVVSCLFAISAAVANEKSTLPHPRTERKYNRFVKLMLNELVKIRYQAEEYLKENNWTKSPSPDYPYWNFLPQYLTSVKASAPTATWSGTCFKQHSATFSKADDGKTLNIEIVSTEPTSLTCSDLYAAFTTSVYQFYHEIKASRNAQVTTTLTLTLPDDVTDAELWDIDYTGVRLYKHLHDQRTTTSNLLETLALFIPEFTQSVPEPIAQMNIEFMKNYAGFAIEPRDPALNIVPDESEVKSGDAFYLMRLDGLNPMLAWAMGSTTGHVTTAMWIDGALYVCESTVEGSYWPTDFVQRTPYRQWIDQVIAADFQVVWAPLNEAARKSYNETAAVEFFKSVEGLDYGFKTLIWGWLDTAMENFPCLPPDFSSNCLQFEILEPFMALVDRKINEIGDTIWNPGFEKRLNIYGLRTTGFYQEAARQGLTMQQVIQIVEDDNWLYNTTRNDEPAVGKSMVCCVFVCNTWKAAGVFGELTDSINCGELTNWDDYALTIHADEYRQIVGEYSLKLNDFKSKDVYAHMAEHCPSLPLDYSKPADC